MLNSLIEVVKEASQIMIEAKDIQEKTEKKGDRNFVTLYDKKVQYFIKERLNTIYPDVKFIGEEDDDSSASPYTEKCFICDPIDGTANFRRSYKHSAISLAYVEYGEVICGVVINPYLNEIFYAEKNKGAYLNGRKIHVSDNDLANSMVSFGTSPYYPDLTQKTFKTIENVISVCEDIRRCGTAALDLCNIACGRYDLFFEYSLFPWDYAASILIISEAGGVISDFSKEKLPLHKRTPVIAGNNIAYSEFFKGEYLVK